MSASSGYVSRDLVIEFCQDLGFQLPQIEFSIKRALSKKLIETHTKNPEVIHEEIPHYRLTSVGAYYYKKMVSMFTYVDAVIVDTPIVNNDFRSEITDAHSIRDRLERAWIFIKYLRSQWQLVAKDGLAFDFVDVLSRLVRDIRAIRRRLLLSG